jgi:hypothetical protein
MKLLPEQAVQMSIELEIAVVILFKICPENF